MLVFEMAFSVPVISQIESIGGGQVGRWGGWEAKGGLKHSKSGAKPSVSDIN